ncbi:uncharacterized protein LOC118438175 [Folsomia candida]|uniref:uncharacterized protein LOC118438175 n=1 Tax=Folsomia candida TaxID=158441 RepID=UPI00160532CB|nr:uncharacterized protein LOC118438175 [Folsomia candida]
MCLDVKVLEHRLRPEFLTVTGSATQSLTLKVEICMSPGFCMQIFEVELPGSVVQPGFVYTAKYSVVPNDILAGKTVQMRAQISHTDTRRVDVCIYCDVDIAPLK